MLIYSLEVLRDEGDERLGWHPNHIRDDREFGLWGMN
jgi:hypothetical protein